MVKQIPIYGRAQDLMHLLDLKKAGATNAILENAEFFPDSMELQAQDALSKTDDQEFEIMEPLQQLQNYLNKVLGLLDKLEIDLTTDNGDLQLSED
ncbi:hypothetical protein Ddye_001791 [Dipteronia dyeriana]|uniref:Uncharacterized protein n=1 Tax=Dipteronia dyeriana TaxID=168575 RepID=A0AAD9XPQ2_9ROSI|nr:hypothetical protein Ddye_001791 [Dipteronia dyeriana]